jgi:hypothetical protein
MKKIVMLIVFALVLTVSGFGYCRDNGDHKTQPVNQNININTQINNQKDTQTNILTNIQTNINGNSFPGVPGSSCNGGHEFGGDGFGWFGWVWMPVGIVTGSSSNQTTNVVTTVNQTQIIYLQ